MMDLIYETSILERLKRVKFSDNYSVKIVYSAQDFSAGKIHRGTILTLALMYQDRHCLRKQCRSRSDGFSRSHLITIYIICQSFCEFIWTNNIELSVGWWSEIIVANLIYSAGFRNSLMHGIPKRYFANSVRQDKIRHNLVSDRGLHILLHS